MTLATAGVGAQRLRGREALAAATIETARARGIIGAFSSTSKERGRWG